MARKKIALIGAGMIGGTLAHLCATQAAWATSSSSTWSRACRKGRRSTCCEAGPIEGFDASIVGTNKYDDIEGADVCIVTAGLPRKPGMSRDDLLSVNTKIMNDVATNIRKHAPNAFVIVITNPLDAMVTAMKRITGFPKQRVVGQAGILDSSRYRTLRRDGAGRLGAERHAPSSSAATVTTWCRCAATARSVASRSRS